MLEAWRIVTEIVQKYWKWLVAVLAIAADIATFFVQVALGIVFGAVLVMLFIVAILRFGIEQKRRADVLEVKQGLNIPLVDTRQLAESVASHLVRDTRWLADASEVLSLGALSRSLYAERLRHFRHEKEFLAEQFAPLLLSRCKAAVADGKDVILLVDSGTTLLPVFQRLGEAAHHLYAQNERWLDHVVIATNNLPGVTALMDCGLVDPQDRYSGLAIKCRLLPGTPVPVYAAVTGPETEEALRRMRGDELASPNRLVIGLVTGNWVRIRREGTPCPVPLARGEGHLDFKQALIDSSDETFVIAPLGKVFVHLSLDGVNAGLDYADLVNDVGKRSYDEVRIDEDKAGTVKLVSTVRPRGFLLATHSTQVVSRLLDAPEPAALDELKSQFGRADILALPHALFQFDRLAHERGRQLEEEFPHAHTRQADFLKTYFSVESMSPDGGIVVRQGDLSVEVGGREPVHTPTPDGGA